MEYQTPGVYIREVDSGPKPIAAVATSIPAFLGLFPYVPRADAVSITGTLGGRTLTARLLPALVDEEGALCEPEAAVRQLSEQLGLRRGQVRDLKQLLRLNGHEVGFQKAGDAVRISGQAKGAPSVEVPAALLSGAGRVLVEEEDEVEALLERVHPVFPLDRPAPRAAADLMAAYGITFRGAQRTSLFDDYSVPPWAVTHKKDFFRWLQSFFARYLVETVPTADLLGRDIPDPDDAADAVFEALGTSPALKERLHAFLSQPTVMAFVAAVQGFYDNGGGKAWVYLMGVRDVAQSIRGDAAGRTGLHAFDDCEDVAIMAAPGLLPHQQKEVLEHCEVRKDRFAVLDGPIVSDGELEVPASDRGYGAMYVPWLRVPRPSWFVGEQAIEVGGPLRRKLDRASAHELYVPPSGHVVGVMARVDGERGVHKAPANELVLGITGLSQQINKLEQGRYNERGINVIRHFDDRGTRIWGARTLATKSNPEWRYVNVRRLFIMVEQSVMSGSQWAVFEPNDPFLWSKLTRDVRAFLLRVWRSGALFGRTAEEAFFVRCDDEINPRHLVDAGQVHVQIGIAPVKPAEFVVFSIGQWDGGASLVE